MVRRHLMKCLHCRVRLEDLEGRRANRVINLYRDSLYRDVHWLSDNKREEFSKRLVSQLRQETARRRWWSIPPFHLSFKNLFPRIPALAVGVALGCVAASGLFLWLRARVPNITANALLVRAEKWETPVSASSSGVVYQEVRISTQNQTVDRSIYRDVQRKRRLKLIKLADRDETLRNMLLTAGVDWNEPISASSYQGWHDHQHEREDRITRAGSHLLLLTTRVPDGSVSEQSLMVRDTDFHPVRRTIVFRDSKTMDIAELDYKTLPWNDVDARFFEPIGGVLSASAPRPSIQGSSASSVLAMPSPEQLDEMELGVRLILNHLHADVDEQIEVHRSAQEIEVDGVVDTEERKRQLTAQLRIMPHLVVSIRSVSELKNNPGALGKIESVQTASMPDLQSPLETYLLTRGHSVDDSSILAHELFNAALTISQESKVIEDLQVRFAPGEPRTILSSATLSELIYSHHERLESALKRERELLAKVQGGVGADGASASSASSLMAAANRNLALCRELTQTDRPTARSAENILAGITMAMDALVADVREVYGKPQGDTARSEEK